MSEHIERKRQEAHTEQETVWKEDLAPPAHPEVEFATTEDGEKEQTSEARTQTQTYREDRSSQIFRSYQRSMEGFVAVPLGQFTQFQTDLTDFLLYEMEQAMAAQRQNAALMQSIYTDFLQAMAYSTRLGTTPRSLRKEYREPASQLPVETATRRSPTPSEETTATQPEDVEISETDTEEQQKITPTEPS